MLVYQMVIHVFMVRFVSKATRQIELVSWLLAGPYGRQHDLADPGRCQHFRHCLPDTWQRWDRWNDVGMV